MTDSRANRVAHTTIAVVLWVLAGFVLLVAFGWAADGTFGVAWLRWGGAAVWLLLAYLLYWAGHRTQGTRAFGIADIRAWLWAEPRQARVVRGGKLQRPRRAMPEQPKESESLLDRLEEYDDEAGVPPHVRARRQRKRRT